MYLKWIRNIASFSILPTTSMVMLKWSSVVTWLEIIEINGKKFKLTFLRIFFCDDYELYRQLQWLEYTSFFFKKKSMVYS